MIVLFSRIVNAIRTRLSLAFVPSILKIRGVRLTGGAQFIGMPIVQSRKRGSITIRSNVKMISVSWATALGVNHPIILRTLTENSQIEIGEGSGISGGTICAALKVTIGKGCLLGANVTIVDTDFHHITPSYRHDSQYCHLDAKEVVIGNNVFIGTGSIVLKGVMIGDNSVIGAGSVVSKSVPENVIAAGNPCRVIKSIGA